jgi:hypothetical protein
MAGTTHAVFLTGGHFFLVYIAASIYMLFVLIRRFLNSTQTNVKIYINKINKCFLTRQYTSLLP